MTLIFLLPTISAHADGGEPALVDGYYQISNADQLLWFANYVNSGNPGANVRLMNDIVLNENLLDKVSKGETQDLITWIPIGTPEYPYKGEFKTDTFAISGLYVNNPEQDYVGLFGYYAPENTQYVYYINVKDSYFTGHDYVGGLFGYVNSEKARLSYFYFRGEVSGNSNVGGLFGKIDVFENISRGYVSAKVTGSSNVGSVCGYLDGKTESNYFTNCYYDTQYSSMGAINGTDDVDNKIMGKNTFHTGEVAYLISFVQDLSDPLSYPELKGKVIHKNISGDGYHNPEYKEHHCKYCIHYTYTLPPCVDDVYQISTADELYGFMHLVNIGNNNIDAVLTANIVVNENVLEKVHSGNTEGLRVWYSIGATYNTFFDIAEKYYGNFDGQFHTISGLYFNNDISFGTAQSGFFDDIYYSVKNVILKDTYFRSPENNIGGIANCMEDTKLKSVNNVNYLDGYTEPIIENCIFDGEIIGNEVGGICCGTVGSTRNIMKIQNCISFAKIKCGMYSAGILAASWSGGCSVINCYNAGEIVCAEQDGYYVGGISGGASLYGISNCYNTGKVTNGYGIYGTHWTPVNITNAYNNRDVCSDYMYDSNGDNITGGGNTTTATLCNGTIPEGFSSDDWIPGKTETKDGKIVYTFPHLKVFDGKYPAYSITKDEQSFTEPALVDGYYQITSADQLLWFSNYVNSGNTDAKAALCADIVLNENLLDKVSKGETQDLITWIPIGTPEYPYKGEFKTDTFAISGLYVNNPEQDYVGLFGYYAPENSNTIYYLSVKDSYFAGRDYVGGLFGYVNSDHASIDYYYFRGEVSGNNYVGGLCGRVDDLSSFYYGYVSAKVTGTSNVGSVCGYLDANEHFYTCYYDTRLCSVGAVNGNDDTKNDVVGKNTFQIGEVAYLLNFCQDMSDPSSFPEFKGKHVHKNLDGDGYHNPEYEDHHCKYCINYTYRLPKLVDGVYQISNADELYGFMHIVNNGNTHANAVLTADIVVNENVLENVHTGNTEGLREWYSIGDNGWLGYHSINGSFAGIFDGNFHTISGLYFDSQLKGGSQSGFMGDFNGIVKNVIITDSYFHNSDVGGIVWILMDIERDEKNREVINHNTYPVIENCIFDGEIIGEGNVAGICKSFSANNNGDYIKNCINYGKIIGGTYSGGILGASWGHGSVVNCYNAGELVCTDESDGDYTAFGGICGGASVAGISNCYNTGSVSFGHGVYGYHWMQCNITNTYNNSDICNLPLTTSDTWANNITGGGNTTTATLCNGTLPEGFSSDDWIPGKTETKDGKIVYTFPHLKVFEGKYPAYSITKDEQSFTEPALVDGYYQITSAVDLLWFAEYVNSGHPEANAKLCADIILNENLLSKIEKGKTENLVTWIPIGTADNPYKGTFTTDTFAISGLYVNDPNLNYVGLFGYYDYDGESLSDMYFLTVNDSYFAGHDYVGGLFGYVNSPKVHINNFYFRGKVSGNSNVGGLFGKIDNYNGIRYGYVSANVTGNSDVGSVCGYLDGKTENNSFDNLYYDTQLCTLGAINGTDDVENNIIGKNTFHTGEVANILGFQDLSDPSSFPEFKGQFVHKNLSGSGYHNPEYEDHHCKYCINYTYSLPQLVDGVYQISTADELYGFMHLVNTGYNYANAVLTADLVVNENVLEKVHSGNTEGLREWYSIGEAAVKYGGNYEQDNPFYGVFNGNLHSISGLYFDSKIVGDDQVGLFAFVLGTVKNVIIKDTYFKAETGSIGGISRYMGSSEDRTANPIIENCIFDGEIDATYGGGICGSVLDASSAIINNCINYGKISGEGNGTSGILGADWSAHASVINCYNAGEIINSQEYAQNGGICGWACIAGIYNCYNTGIVSGGYGVYGQHWCNCPISNIYNNSDICNLPILYNGPHTITGGGNLTSATLCNGTLPEGFSSDDWIPGKTVTADDGTITYTFPHLKVFDGKYPAHIITKPGVKAIAIKTPPTQTEYALGEDLSKDGLVVTFTYSDHTTIDVDYYGSYDQTSTEYQLKNSLMDSDFDFDNTSTGKKTVTITYNDDLTAEFDVTVVDKGKSGYQYLDEDGTLTFYYGNYRNGAGYIGENGCSRPFENELIKKAVFDPSFIDFKPTNLTNLLSFYPNLQEIVDMDKYLNTEEVVNMMWMFGYCPLTVLDLSAFDTRKVKNMGCMFADCSGPTNFTTIYVGDKWSTESLDPCMMFFNCTNLVGGKGTKCNETTWDNNDYIYARIDDPEHGKPGYFTYKAPKPENPYTEPEVKNNAYQISSAEDLLYFMFDVNNGNVDANAILTQDIVVNADLFTQISDLLKRTTKAGNALNEWTPIGTAENPFRGTFDGNGHIISGIYIKDETQNNVGLFGNVSKDAVIKNLGVTDSYIAGNENVGAICGKSEGTVVNCYTVSEVVGNKNVNPLVGAKEKAAVVQNSFYLADSPKADDPCAKTAEQFKSGEVAAQLAKGATINGVTYSGESFAGLTELPGTENIEVISDPENPPIPVSEISPNINVNVWSYNHIIYIENAPDAEYRIIDLNGRLITTSTTKSTKEEIQINKSGILIVIIGNQSFKVSL